MNRLSILLEEISESVVKNLCDSTIGTNAERPVRLIYELKTRPELSVAEAGLPVQLRCSYPFDQTGPRQVWYTG